MTDYLCIGCLKTLHKCYNMKTIAQTMIRNNGNRFTNHLNPDASEFRPRRHNPRPDSPYPSADSIPLPDEYDDSYYYEGENGRYQASHEELSGSSSSGSPGSDQDNYSQFRLLPMDGSSTFADLRVVERTQNPTNRMFSRKMEQTRAADNVVVEESPPLGPNEPWYVSSDEDLDVTAVYRPHPEEINVADDPRYQPQQNNSDSSDEAVFFITLG